MNKNISVQKPDLTEAVNSAIKLYFNYTSTSSAHMTKFFDDELYRNTIAWKHFVAPTITDENNAALTKMSKRVTKHLSFANKIYSDVARTIKKKFTDEELRCIVQAIISYLTYKWNAYYNIRQYVHHFIKNSGKDIYLLDNLKSYKSRISRIRLFEFEILMDFIFLLMEDNKPDYIFKLIRTM